MKPEQHKLAMAHYRECADDAWDDIEEAMNAMEPLYQAAPDLLEAIEWAIQFAPASMTAATDNAKRIIAKARGQA